MHKSSHFNSVKEELDNFDNPQGEKNPASSRINVVIHTHIENGVILCNKFLV